MSQRFSATLRRYFTLLAEDELDALSAAIAHIVEKISGRFNVRLSDSLTTGDIMALAMILLPFINDDMALGTITSFGRDLLGSLRLSNRQADVPSDVKNSFRDYIEENKRLLEVSINQVSNKLLVNWGSVLPICLDEYKNMKLYADTVAYMRGQDDNGLYVGDIYNTIALDLYWNVRKVKWLLYEVEIDGTLVSFDEVLKTLFPSPRSKTDYDDVMNALRQGGSKSGVGYDVILRVIKVALVYFDNSYTASAERGYRSFRSIREEQLFDEVDGDDFDPGSVTDEHVIDNFAALGHEHWLAYMHDVYRHFGYTWYSKKPHILHDIEVPRQSLIGIPKLHVTRKNVYHFAKNFYLRNSESWGEICSHWEELTDQQKSIQKAKMITSSAASYLQWLNTDNYITRTYGIVVNQEITPFFNLNALPLMKEQEVKTAFRGRRLEAVWKKVCTMYIVDRIYEDLPDIVFESLIYKGVLSRLVVTGEGTPLDKKRYTSTSYHFMTGDVLGERHFERMTLQWTSMYAMHWISQLNAFHKMFHNRIHFITGGTGVGKSTQIPKLLLYACRMLFYNNSAQVICTQPRIAPTVENATRISKELGLPISDGFNYIQYKHGNGAHPALLPQQPFYFTTCCLVLVTDGVLRERLASNLSLLRYKTEKNSFSRTNVFDVVIVDEAHEHNTNMDLILTLMRRTLLINPSVKLAIISATMDTDELRYRSFYKAVDDNRVVPYTRFRMGDRYLDKQFVDRRIHISPFQQTTRAVIDEVYLPRDTGSYDEAEVEGIRTVLRITSQSSSGDILFFSVGQNEIDSIVETLNTKLPSHVIALPFYSKLPDTFNSVVGKIHENKQLFYYDKRVLLDLIKNHPQDWSDPGLPYPPRQVLYTQVVIVATNIAEASITIPSLRYVVDTGYSKNNAFRFDRGVNDTVLEKISESSRVQRKGRVGRVAQGTVYYMYARHSREDIKPRYKICDENVYADLHEIAASSASTQYNLESFARVFSRYYDGRTLLGMDPPPFALSFQDLLDPSYTFHIIHPDEYSLVRNNLTGAAYVALRARLPIIDNFLRRHAIYREVFREDKLQRITVLKRQLKNPSLTLYDIVALLMAYNMGVFEQYIQLKFQGQEHPLCDVFAKYTFDLYFFPFNMNHHERVGVCLALAMPFAMVTSRHVNLMSGAELTPLKPDTYSPYLYDAARKTELTERFLKHIGFLSD